MNEERRKALREAISLLDEVRGKVKTQKEDEQSAFDALPENMQGGEKGEAMEAAIPQLDEAVNELETAISSIEQAI